MLLRAGARRGLAAGRGRPVRHGDQLADHAEGRGRRAQRRARRDRDERRRPDGHRARGVHRQAVRRHPAGPADPGHHGLDQRDHQGPDLRALPGQVHPRAPGGGRGGQPRPRHGGRASPAGLRPGPGPGRRARRAQADRRLERPRGRRGHHADLPRHRAGQPGARLRGAGQDRRAQVRARRAERGVRRRDVLPAVPGGAGEARPGVLGVQLQRTARRHRHVGHLRRAACPPRPTRCWPSAPRRSPGWSRAA